MRKKNLVSRLMVAATVTVLTACAGSPPEPRERNDPRPEATVLRDTSDKDGDSSIAVAREQREEIVVTGSALDRAASTRHTQRPAKAAHPVLPERDAMLATGNRVQTNDERQISNTLGAASLANTTHVTQCCPTAPTEPINAENYAHYDDNGLTLVSDKPVSTFSIDVDTGAYANVRRMLNAGTLPPRDAVRVEELVNYFSYDYPTPRSRRQPFNVTTELATTPWNPDTLLLHVGLKGYEVSPDDRPPANLVFLVDVSGSMRSPDKLPLLKDALKMLTRQMGERDTIAIAGYAGGAGLILEPTSGAHKRDIIRSLDNLHAAGRTNGAAGIHLAYELAQRAFVDGGINRVIIATDGDFNVGTVNFAALVDLIEEKRRHGVALTALGFGTGNYNDKLLEQLADAGNGNYAYIDNQREAHKVLVEEMSSTLQTIAKDVKIQIEFNPAVVAEYRLIGYENRLLRREDFNNDQIDAGEIGAGHTVTALYELTLQDSASRLNDPLRYAQNLIAPPSADEELAFVKLRYKQPDGNKSQLIERPLTRNMIGEMTTDFGFAAAVAAFGQRLRGADFLRDYDLQQIATLAQNTRGADQHGYRGEFVELVERAQHLTQAVAHNRDDDNRYHVSN